MPDSANILLLVSDPLDASISIQRDLLALQDGLRQLDAAVTFHVRAAEAEKIQDHLSRGNSPRYAVLHYLGHGYKAPDDADGVLIFEKDDGSADALDQIRLSLTLKGAAAEFKLAVISACHSASVANGLFAVGVEHVVAIDGDKTVYEAAAVAFCRRFYQSLLTGRNLLESFTSGKEALLTDPTMRRLGNAATSAEADKFKLLSRPGFDPAQFSLAVGSGQTRLEEWPALTHPPFDQQPAEFIGRNEDMRELIAALNQKRAAIIVGVSGVGKTELAKQTARRFAARCRVDKPEDVAFASLVNAKSAEEARIQIALALGLPPDGIADNGALQRAIPRHRLLILDEAENVIARDGLAFRQLLDAVITAPTNPFVIVTSQTNPNTSKAPPVQLHRLSEVAALQLFVANTGLDGEDFRRINREHLLEVLKAVDRLPRAIELIARVWWQERGSDAGNLDMTSLVAKLREDRDLVMTDPDYPDDVKSVSVGVKYAYDRLLERSPAAARLWTQLALFPGGISKAGVPQIFGAESAALVNQIEKQSLVESAFTHFPAPFGNLLELPTPFRFFALRHLGDEAAARQTIGESVLRYYFDSRWVDRLDEEFCQGTTGIASRFKAELPSIEAWLDWAYDNEPTHSGLSRASRLTALLRNIYELTTALRGLNARCEQAFACALRCQDKKGEADILVMLGELKLRIDDLEGARVDYERALPIYKMISDRQGEALALKAFGDLAMRLGNFPEAQTVYEQALAIYQDHPSGLGRANVFQGLGYAKLGQRDYEGARADFGQALPLYQKLQNRMGEATIVSGLGQIALLEGDENLGNCLLARAIDILRNSQIHPYNIAVQIENFGRGLLMSRQGKKAVPYFLRAAEWYDKINWVDLAEKCRQTASRWENS